MEEKGWKRHDRVRDASTGGRERCSMARRPALMLSLVLTVFYAGLGLYFLVPSVYHPFTSDSVNITQAHATAAYVFLGCAAVALTLGGISRLAPRR
jgi:hypothetical protein